MGVGRQGREPAATKAEGALPVPCDGSRSGAAPLEGTAATLGGCQPTSTLWQHVPLCAAATSPGGRCGSGLAGTRHGNGIDFLSVDTHYLEQLACVSCLVAPL